MDESEFRGYLQRFKKVRSRDHVNIEYNAAKVRGCRQGFAQISSPPHFPGDLFLFWLTAYTD